MATFTFSSASILRRHDSLCKNILISYQWGQKWRRGIWEMMIWPMWCHACLELMGPPFTRKSWPDIFPPLLCSWDCGSNFCLFCCQMQIVQNLVEIVFWPFLWIGNWISTAILCTVVRNLKVYYFSKGLVFKWSLLLWNSFRDPCVVQLLLFQRREMNLRRVFSA